MTEQGDVLGGDTPSSSSPPHGQSAGKGTRKSCHTVDQTVFSMSGLALIGVFWSCVITQRPSRKAKISVR